MADGRGIPKAGVFATSEGDTVGRNLAAAINDTQPNESSGVGYCFISYSGRQAATVGG